MSLLLVKSFLKIQESVAPPLLKITIELNEFHKIVVVFVVVWGVDEEVIIGGDMGGDMDDHPTHNVTINIL